MTAQPAIRCFNDEWLLHAETLGIDPNQIIDQGTAEWHRSRAGVITASKGYVLLMKGRLAPFPDDVKIEKIGKSNFVTFGGKDFDGTKAQCVQWVREQLPIISSETRASYMNELIGQIATGLIPDEIKAKQLEHGKFWEPDARAAYSAKRFQTVEEIAFIYNNNSMRAGCSPDGIIKGLPEGLELKCPYSSSVFIDFAGRGKIKPEEIVQCQFSMWVTGFERWNFAKFDPRNKNCKKLHCVTLVRDEKMIAEIQAGYDSFVIEMDHLLESMGMSFGMQWQD
ncbi:MAG: hypothetical protein ACJAYB_000105 [Psychromonas sp.]|jgi:hypothetical protein